MFSYVPNISPMTSIWHDLVVQNDADLQDTDGRN